MGNKQAHADQAQIAVMTDKPYYTAGETVTGHVYINCFHSFHGSQLFLKVKGKEDCWWKEQHTETYSTTNAQGQHTTQSRTVWRDYYGKNLFFGHKIILFSFQGGTLQPGQYSFPFQFMLPNYIPGTFNDSQLNYKGQIKYKLKAEIQGNKDSKSKLKNNQELIVREPVKQVVAQQFGENTIHAKTWCCISQGDSSIKCHFETNTYVPGEHAKIISEIDNSKCKLDVKCVEAKLLKIINLKSHHGRPFTCTQVVSQINLPGLGHGEDRTGQNAIMSQLQLVEQNKGPLQPSTNGQLVNCQYKLQVRVVLDGCTCCSSQPEIIVPIGIVCPPLQDFGAIQAPQNWNPQQYPVVNITFQEKDMYVKLNAEGEQQRIQTSASNSMTGLMAPQMQQQPQMVVQQNQVIIQMNNNNNQHTLLQGGELRDDHSLYSENGKYQAVMQRDGNFVVYETYTPFQGGSGNAIWSSQSYGKGQGPYRLTLQPDGNLCIYDVTGVCTYSNNAYGRGSGPYRLVMQNDRNLVQYDNVGTPVWTSV